VIKRLHLLSTILILALSCVDSAAQTSPKDKSIEDKFRSDEIERVRRTANKRDEHQAVLFPQIKQDFEQIQLISSDLVQAVSSPANLDRDQVFEGAAEIRRRATRLRSQLFGRSEKGKEKQVQPGTERRDFRVLVGDLDQAITRFVHNPMFKNTRVINPRDSSRAERELANVIRLSGLIKPTK
jgi:hypothetical protein